MRALSFLHFKLDTFEGIIVRSVSYLKGLLHNMLFFRISSKDPDSGLQKLSTPLGEGGLSKKRLSQFHAPNEIQSFFLYSTDEGTVHDWLYCNH